MPSLHRLLALALGLLSLSLLVCPAEAQSPIDTLPPGHWYEVPNSNLSAIDPEDNPAYNPNYPNDAPWHGVEGIAAVMNDWAGGAFDTSRDRLIVTGGGHQGYAGNELYVFDLNTLTWAMVSPPSLAIPPGDPWDVACDDEYSDGTPRSKHTYDSIDYISADDKLFIWGGANYCNAGDTNPDTWEFDFDTLTWIKKDYSHPKNTWVTTTSVAGYDTVTNNMFVSNPSIGLLEYNASTDTWTQRSTDWLNYGEGTVAIDPVRRQFVYIGHGGIRGYDLNSYSYKTYQTSGANAIEGAHAPGFEYYPAIDKFVAWDGGSDVYTLDMDTMVWTRVQAQGGATPTGPNSQGTYGRFRYSPTKDVFVVVNHVDENVFIYKFDRGQGNPDTSPPTIPQNLSAATVTKDNIVLAWDASTDPESGVAKYNIYRGGSFVGETTTTGYSDTGLTPDTEYSYEVSAVNGVGLESTKSSPLVVTTLPLGQCGSYVTDPTLVLLESTTPKPGLFVDYTDPQLGGCIKRITDAAALGSPNPVPIYSQLQAWNSDETRILLADNRVLDASDFSVVDQTPYLVAPKWSQTDPNIIYGFSDNSVITYDITTQATTTLRTFSEYTTIEKNPSFEEMSLDGRYMALSAIRVSDGGTEAFAYDVVNDIKHTPLDTNNKPCGKPDIIAMAPLGNYVIVNWAAGGEDRYCTVEAYDLDMNFVGTVATGHGHGDITIDKSGVQWFVDFSPDNYVGITGPVIKKNRIPDGYTAYVAGDNTAIQVLTRVDWDSSMHISGQTPYSDWVIASTYAGRHNGWQAFDEEVFRVYFDSTEAQPHLERIAHHRSDGTCDYWAQPHATSNRSGTKIMFGSTWSLTSCTPEAYIIDLSQQSQLTPPRNLRVN